MIDIKVAQARAVVAPKPRKTEVYDYLYRMAEYLPEHQSFALVGALAYFRPMERKIKNAEQWVSIPAIAIARSKDIRRGLHYVKAITGIGLVSSDGHRMHILPNPAIVEEWYRPINSGKELLSYDNPMLLKYPSVVKVLPEITNHEDLPVIEKWESSIWVNKNKKFNKGEDVGLVKLPGYGVYFQASYIREAQVTKLLSTPKQAEGVLFETVYGQAVVMPFKV